MISFRVESKHRLVIIIPAPILGVTVPNNFAYQGAIGICSKRGCTWLVLDPRDDDAWHSLLFLLDNAGRIRRHTELKSPGTKIPPVTTSNRQVEEMIKYLTGCVLRQINEKG